MASKSARKWKNWKAALCKAMSPVRWIALAVKMLNQYVNRNTIICFACLEIVISFLISVIFYIYPDIDDVGFIFHDWKWFCLFTFFRIFCAPVGIFAACMRKVATMKLYFSLTMINIFLVWLLFAPFFSLECACSEYRQCVSLSTFTSRKIDNDFPEPNKVKYQSSRIIPYADPPKKLESQGDEYSTSYEDQLDMEDMDVDSGSSGRSLACLEEPGNPVCDRRRLEESAAPSEKLNVMDYYTITYPDIWWVSEVQPGCDFYTMPTIDKFGRKAFYWAKELAGIYMGKSEIFTDFQITRSSDLQNENNVIALKLTEKIWSCATQERCSVVQASVKWDEATDKTTFSVCSLLHQSVPVLAKTQMPTPLEKDWKEGKEYKKWQDEFEALDEKFKVISKEEGKGQLVLRDFSIFFQKDPLTANAGYLLKQRLFNRQGMSQEEGTKLMLDVFNQGCVCDRKDDCQAYYNNRGEPRYWCWVNNKATRRYCDAQGIKLYNDPDTLKWWTDEICEKAGCKCVYIGVAPNKDVHARRDVLEENLLNYGSRCKKWNEGDEHEWCNVGFDTTCADRNTVEAAIPAEEDNSRTFRYYKSYIPCDQTQKTKDVNKAHNTCRIIQILSLSMLFILTIVSLPMTVVIFTFVKNRCGDHFAEEQQFDVRFSSDSESDNDWEIEEHPPKPEGESGEGESRQDVSRQSIDSFDDVSGVPAHTMSPTGSS